MCLPLQWLAEPTPTERIEARAKSSNVVPVNTVTGLTYSDRDNGGQSNALNCRVRHQSGWLSPRRPSEQRPEQHPHLSWPPTQWLAESTPTEQTQARVTP
jgi:hypothetical protein